MWVAAPHRLNPGSNAFFAKLPADLRREMEPSLEYVSLAVGQDLISPGHELSHLYLPLTCVAGVVNVSEEGESTLVAMVGSEGFVGVPAFMSGKVAGAGASVFIPGLAMRVPVGSLRTRFQSDLEFQDIVQRYTQAFVAEIIQTAHCSRHHTPVGQLSTLLLRAQDKQGANDLLLTHERSAALLGVRRETVSHAARLLQLRDLLAYRRGHIRVVDRGGLENAACRCYGKVRRIYEEVYGFVSSSSSEHRS